MAIITLGGSFKSGRQELATTLSKELGYETINREVITECSKKYNIMENDLLENLEDLPNLWRRLKGDHRRQLIYLKCALLSIAKQDNIIYYGPSGQIFLAHAANVLKIRLEAPFKERVNKVAEELNKSLDEATEYVVNIDKNRSRKVKLLYDEDWRNPALYDMNINFQHISNKTAADIVITAIKSKEFQTNEHSKKILNKLSLECEVKAAIAADDAIWNQQITVVASEHSIILRGFVKSKKIRERIVETASQVKGVEKCEVFLDFQPTH